MKAVALVLLYVQIRWLPAHPAGRVYAVNDCGPKVGTLNPQKTGSIIANGTYGGYGILSIHTL